jgi:hypothetical protein
MELVNAADRYRRNITGALGRDAWSTSWTRAAASGSLREARRLRLKSVIPSRGNKEFCDGVEDLHGEG